MMRINAIELAKLSLNDLAWIEANDWWVSEMIYEQMDNPSDELVEALAFDIKAQMQHEIQLRFNKCFQL